MSLKPWLLGARPKTLPAVISPVILGVAFGAHQVKKFNGINALLVLIIGLAFQIAVNYANDYSDGIRGSDDNRVGPLRLVASGLAKPKQVKTAAFLMLAIAAVAGLIFSFRTSPWFILLGLISIFATWGYTGGKNPYGYRGFGEISVFIFFGLIATLGSSYGQAKEFSWIALALAIAMGSFACAILMANNIRDIPTDSQVNKKTLAVRLGDSRARKLAIGFLATPFIILIALSFPIPWLILALITVIPVIKLIKIISSQASGKELIPVLAGVGKIQLSYAVLSAVLVLVSK